MKNDGYKLNQNFTVKKTIVQKYLLQNLKCCGLFSRFCCVYEYINVSKADCPVKSFDSKSNINYLKPYLKSNDLIKRGQGGN